MSVKPFSYQYHQRPSDFLNYFCLDFNEYQGEIASSTVKVLQNQKLIQHYPLVDDTSLVQKLSRFLTVPEKNMALTAGADEALFHILLLSKIKYQFEVARLFFSPTYDHVVHFMEVLNFQVLHPADHSGCHLVYLSFPNNPTGAEISPEELERIIQIHKKSLLVLDLTYIFYSRYKIQDYKNMILSHENVVAVLSLAKAFPLAGLRMACVLSSNPQLMKYFQRDYNKKAVNTLARAVTLDCLKNKTFYQKQQKQIIKNKKPLADLFQNLARRENIGVTAMRRDLLTGGGNFFRMTGNPKERKHFLKLLYSKKIIVRNKEGWDFLRVTSVCDSLFNQIKKRLGG